MIYIATGNGYADPPQPTTDAIIALDIETGAVKWIRQVTPNDQWTLGCQAQNPDKPECPAALGPDFDFSASPTLTRVNGRDLIVLPQKAGIAWALDPDNEGNVVWQFRIGQGSGLGGQWGAATDGQNMYVGVNDFLTQSPGGMHAIHLADGKPLWHVGPQPTLCDKSVRGCVAAQGGAVTVIPCCPDPSMSACAPTPRPTARSSGSSTRIVLSTRSTASRRTAPAWTEPVRWLRAGCCS
jgi:polyvinyl alcohol dehydrogenase (cytochrome)